MSDLHSSNVHKNLSNKGGGERRTKSVWIRCWKDPAAGDTGLLPAASNSHGWAEPCSSPLSLSTTSSQRRLSCHRASPTSCESAAGAQAAVLEAGLWFLGDVDQQKSRGEHLVFNAWRPIRSWRSGLHAGILVLLGAPQQKRNCSCACFPLTATLPGWGVYVQHTCFSRKPSVQHAGLLWSRGAQVCEAAEIDEKAFQIGNGKLAVNLENTLAMDQMRVCEGNVMLILIWLRNWGFFVVFFLNGRWESITTCWSCHTLTETGWRKPHAGAFPVTNTELPLSPPLFVCWENFKVYSLYITMAEWVVLGVEVGQK